MEKKNNVEKWKKVAGWLGAAVLAIGAFFAYLLGTRRSGFNRRRIQRNNDIIDNGRKRTEEIKSTNQSVRKDNREAKQNIDAAGRNIDKAIDGVANAKRILGRARNRSKK